MGFPAYVPAAVRAHITTLLDGDDWEPQGWAATLADAEKSLAEIETAIETRIRRGEVEYLDSLRKQRAEAVEHRDRLAGDVDCLHRLADDERMQEAYAKLTKEFTHDEQWRGFVDAAWAARIDYSKYRERLKRTAELRDKIADTSEKLAGLLREAADTGFPFWPSEFFGIPELLRQTDNHEMQNHNLHMWRSMRKYVLGDPSRSDVPESEQPQEESESKHVPEIVSRVLEPDEKPEIDPEEEARNTLRYAWGTAPDLSELLDTVTKAARSFQPSESGMIGAGIESRKASIKTEYLRAFGSLLTSRRDFSMTAGIMNAMAVTAIVVLNQSKIDVSYDDVRKALSKLGG